MRRYAYLLVFDDELGTQEEVRKFIDSHEDVFQNWYAVLPNSFFIVSDKSATQITDMLHELRLKKGGGRFIVVDLDTDRNGWLPRSTWDFIRNPMLVIHIVRSGSTYFIGGFNVGNKENLIAYLEEKGITQKNINKALEELQREGKYTIYQE